MAMIRREAKGDYQIGIYAVVHDPVPATRTGAVPPWRATTDFGYDKRFRTLSAAYKELTGEPLRTPRVEETKSYLITWQIDIEATSHKEAAEKALLIHRKPDSIATVFYVEEHKGMGRMGDKFVIDLTPGEG